MNDITGGLARPGASPFDSIRREDADGEHWSARDLMPLLDYENWRRFEDAIERARWAASNVGADSSEHFSKIVDVDGADKINDQGYRQRDYRLTRYGAYLIAMNGDPRKPEVAKAQTYFAVKTREAETRETAPALPDISTPAGVLAMAEQFAATARQLVAVEAKVAEQATELDQTRPKAAYVDTYVRGREDAVLLRVLAKQLAVGEKALRDHLRATQVLYRQGTQWLPHAGYEDWFVLRDQPKAPRDHNGQLRTTLYVTPVGKVRIRALLARDIRQPALFPVDTGT